MHNVLFLLRLRLLILFHFGFAWFRIHDRKHDPWDKWRACLIPIIKSQREIEACSSYEYHMCHSVYTTVDCIRNTLCHGCDCDTSLAIGTTSTIIPIETLSVHRKRQHTSLYWFQLYFLLTVDQNKVYSVAASAFERIPNGFRNNMILLWKNFPGFREFGIH